MLINDVKVFDAVYMLNIYHLKKIQRGTIQQTLSQPFVQAFTCLRILFNTWTVSICILKKEMKMTMGEKREII